MPTFEKVSWINRNEDWKKANFTFLKVFFWACFQMSPFFVAVAVRSWWLGKTSGISYPLFAKNYKMSFWILFAAGSKKSSYKCAQSLRFEAKRRTWPDWTNKTHCIRDGPAERVRTLRCNDCDDNETVKKAISWIGKTTSLHMHHAFFFINFFAVTTRLRRENAKFHVLWRT